MDYKSIVCFLRVCELHSFTKAAEDLYISQPALSRRILALEDELGVKLLDRANGGLQFTEGGKLFYSDAKKLINVEAALKQKMEKHRDGFYGEVRIGYSSYCFMEPLMHAAHMLGETYPNIEPDFQSMSPRYAIYSFLHGQIDIAYLCRGDIPQTNDSVIEVIAKAQSVILIPKGHKLWDRQYVTCSDLVGERFAISKPKARFRIPYVRALKPKEYSLKTPYNANLQTPGSFKSQLEDISAWTEYIHLNISIIMRIAFVRSLARIWILTLLIIARCIIHPTEMRNAL